MNLFEILTLRSEFEDMTLNMRVPGDKKPGTISNLRWFIKNAEERNKKFKELPYALKIATLITDDYDQRRKARNGRRKQKPRARELGDAT